MELCDADDERHELHRQPRPAPGLQILAGILGAAGHVREGVLATVADRAWIDLALFIGYGRG